MGNKVKDLTGQTFGYLTALEPTEKRYHNSAVWRCRCVCGKIVEKDASSLQSPLNNPSCGCQRIRHSPGERYGRLVTVRPLATRKCKRTEWILRCDCGNLIIRPIWTKSKIGGMQPVQSCGCLSRGRERKARCPACGEYFPIVLDGSPTPQFCPDCTPKYAGRNWKVCPVCKKLFPDPPSNKSVTCSKSCSAKWRASLREGAPHPWSSDAKGRLSAKGQTENLKLGTAAAKKSPIAGRFETNQEAKVWTLIDPSGRETTVTNLLLWAREHTELFNKPPGDKSASQISHGFQAIAATLRGVRGAEGKPRGAMTYFGWTLKRLPEPPPD